MLKTESFQNFEDRLHDYSDRLTISWLKSFEPSFDLFYIKRLIQELLELRFEATSLQQNEIVNAVNDLIDSLEHVKSTPACETRQEDTYRELTALFRIIERSFPAVLKSDRGGSNHNEGGLPLVYLLDDSRSHLVALTAQIELFGYRVITFQKLDDLVISVRQLLPDVIIADVVIEEGLTPDLWIKAFGKRDFLPKDIPPVIFMSGHDLNLVRLKSVKAGGEGFLTKPINMNRLVDMLGTITLRVQQSSLRVLIVEDQKSQGNYYQSLLKGVGIQTQLCTEVEDALDIVESTSPDVILLDLYMPEFSGVEVALAIRQKIEHSNAQIIFLSSERNPDKQKEVLMTIGDAFLEKPIDPDYLKSLVTTRAKHARKLTKIMARDSLTNLLNHGEIKRMIKMEALRSGREKTPLSLAMIDIDRFKQVNDSYGHIIGDQVIRTLALLLSDSLRRTDLIGRYGGEEFVVIMPNTTLSDAKKVIEWQLEKFSALSSYGDKKFSCTFSAGVSMLVDDIDSDDLLAEADEALYLAKNNGRNQVTTFLR